MPEPVIVFQRQVHDEVAVAVADRPDGSRVVAFIQQGENRLQLSHAAFLRLCSEADVLRDVVLSVPASQFPEPEPEPETVEAELVEDE